METLQANGLQIPVYRRVQFPRWYRLVLNDLPLSLGHRSGAKRRSARQRFVQRRAQTINVRPMIDIRRPLGLLWRHVCRCTNRFGGLCEILRLGERFGQAEIDNERFSV